MFYIYILQCRDGSYYTGHTDNLEHRMYQHYNKKILTCYTSTRLPVKLLYSQTFNTREEALIRKDWKDLSDYSASRRRFAPP